jgi:hypothetical protein
MMSRSKISLARLVGAFLLSFCSFSYSNAQITTTPGQPPIIERQFYDDSYVHVPLQFGFPFYGQTFTNSWMHSNGVVSFLNPVAPIQGATSNPASWAYCCEGINLVPNNPQLGPQFSFMIAPLWTDLYPVGQSRFLTQGDSTFQRYYWENIAEISNMSNLNTFGLEIRPSGFIGAYYQNINIQNQNVTAGITGDIRLGQMQQFYYGRGIPSGALGNWSLNETLADQCTINPLSSPTCPGYTEAMCVTNPLYSTSCSGYQQAYFTQQCSINTLYHPNCPGYASAYLTYQCSLDALYSTTCEGYEQAYFNQQCSINALYDSACPGYQQAYFNLQCSNDALYDRTCPGYSEAYALKFVVVTSPTATTQTVATPTPTSETKVALVEDKNVNDVITTTATSASPANAATTVVPLVSQPSSSTKETTTAEVKEEVKPSSTTSSTTTSTAQSDSNSNKPKTVRQELAERRQAAARAKAVEDGKNLANTMGKSASMEDQIAVQNVVIQAMGFTPGFDSYSKVMIVQTPFYKPEEVYKNQKNVDNRAVGARLFGGTDKVHNEMVDAQYQLGK